MKSGVIAALSFSACLASGCASRAPAPQAAADPPATAAPAGAPPATASTVPPAASAESLTIAFNAASASLSDDANKQLDGAARLYRDAHPEVMIVSGHADKTGEELNNLMLSARRAESVKQGLVDRGIPADRLQAVAIGEAEPVPGIPAARAVVVTWR